MKKKPFRMRVRYWFDCMMERGSAARILLLFVVMIAAVCLIGVIAFLVGRENGLFYELWNSFNHTLDAGTLAGDATGNIPYLIMMTLATLLGLFVTSVLIGIISSAVEDKVNALREGNSIVMEEEHTVIIGFDIYVYDILRELIEANSNKKKACVVILGEQSAEEMEDEIAAHIRNLRTTRVICRSGRLYEQHSFEMCGLENSKSVIVNIHDDVDTIKTLLALSAYLKDNEPSDPDLRIVATIQEGQHEEAAQIAGGERTRIIYVKNVIARIIANTCRQHGLSQVITELFNFSGNEMYFESIAKLAGRTFREACLSFSNAVAVGLYAGGEVCLNPPMDTVIGEDDRIILLEEDDGTYKLHAVKQAAEEAIADAGSEEIWQPRPLFIIGSNDKLPTILSEYDPYVPAGTRVVIIDDDLDENRLPECANLDIRQFRYALTRDFLSDIMESDVNILLLNDDSEDEERADAQTLLWLIQLRDIANRNDRHLSITTELHSVENQKLASPARVDDFVVSSNFANLLMAQIAENPEISPIIEELLDDAGSEFYMKPAGQYVRPGVPVDFYTVTESAARKGEICIGYRHLTNPPSDVVINPDKEEEIVFGDGDQVIVIASE